MIPTAFGEAGGLAVGLPSPAANCAGPVCTCQCITEVEKGWDRYVGRPCFGGLFYLSVGSRALSYL